MELVNICIGVHVFTLMKIPVGYWRDSYTLGSTPADSRMTTQRVEQGD